MKRIFPPFLYTILLFNLQIFNLNAYGYEIQFEKNSNQPIVYLDVMIQKGSTLNPPGLYGLTNFLGESLLRGTNKQTKAQLDQILDQMGAEISVETRAEATLFRGSVLSSKLEPFLLIFNEILTEPKFSEQEIQKLKKELISNLKEELDYDTALAQTRFNERLFQGHPFAFPLLGTEKSIQKISILDLKQHYQKIFQPEFLKILGTGDAQNESIQKWGKNLINQLQTKNPPLKTQDFFPLLEAPKNPNKTRIILIDKPARTQTQIYIGQIGLSMTAPEFYPLYIANEALGGASFSSLLMKEIRVKRGWSYGVSSSFKFGSQPRSWQVHLFPSTQDTPDALFQTLKIIRDFKENGITKNEFEFFQNSLIQGNGFTYNTPKKRLENLIIENILQLPKNFLQSFDQHFSKITVEQMNSSIKKFLLPDQMTVVILGTAKKLKSKIAKKLRIQESSIEVYPYDQSYFD